MYSVGVSAENTRFAMSHSPANVSYMTRCYILFEIICSYRVAAILDDRRRVEFDDRRHVEFVYHRFREEVVLFLFLFLGIFSRCMQTAVPLSVRGHILYCY